MTPPIPEDQGGHSTGLTGLVLKGFGPFDDGDLQLDGSVDGVFAKTPADPKLVRSVRAEGLVVEEGVDEVLHPHPLLATVLLCPEGEGRQLLWVGDRDRRAAFVDHRCDVPCEPNSQEVIVTKCLLVALASLLEHLQKIVHHAYSLVV